MDQRIRELVRRSNFSLSEKDWNNLIMLDYGLGDFQIEGVTITNLVLSDQLRIALLILLPYQTLPEHKHPAYEGSDGKEETVRVLYGQTKVYIEGIENNSNIRIPNNKNAYYTVRHEICLNAGEQYTITPGIRHWFQAGKDGSVMLTFQNRIDESKNIFSDPECSGYK